MIITVCKISYGSQTVPPIVPAVQGDTGRAISFEIADFTPPAGATATYFILKPSGEAIYNSATITNNSILCELTAQSLAEAGENRMQVRVLLGEDIVTSFEVILMVRTFLGDDAIESGTEMNIFDQAVEQATEQFQTNAEQVVEEVIESIPSDYTALTEEVDELNERLTSEEIEISAIGSALPREYTELTVHETNTGYFMLSTGAIRENNSGTIRTYAVEKDKHYNFFSNSYSLPGTDYVGIAFSTSDEIAYNLFPEKILYQVSSTTVQVNEDFVFSEDGYVWVVEYGTRGAITPSEYTYSDIKDIKSDVATLENDVNDIKELIPTTEIVIDYSSENAGYFMLANGTVRETSNTGYKIRVYPVQKNITYHLRSDSYSLAGSYAAVAFDTSPTIEDYAHPASVVLSATTTASEVDSDYTPESNGYLWIALATNRGEITVSYDMQSSVVSEFAFYSLKGKTVGVLGDSIMARMKSVNPPSANVVTFLGEDDITYQYSDLTNINGHLYTANNVKCEIVNSNQTYFDTQNWNRLEELIQAEEIINCAVSASSIHERDIITAYPYYSVNDNLTNCLPNQIRMLKRLTDSGRSKPDCAVIWMGTNDINHTDGTFSDIMSVSWETLSDDTLGRQYRQTTLGGLRYAIECLYRNYPSATIFVFTPIQTNPDNYRTYDKLVTRGNVIKEMARRYSCNIVDALYEIGIVDEYESSDGSGYWLVDGLHPNERGKALYANFTATRLNALYFAKPQVN